MAADGHDLKQWWQRLFGPKRRHAPLARTRQPYHAVSLRNAGCAAAKAIADRRFLASRAPRLPLLGCASAECTCAFAHHDDRRQDARRAADNHTSSPPFEGHNARTGRGRREVDQRGDFDDEYFEYADKRHGPKRNQRN